MIFTCKKEPKRLDRGCGKKQVGSIGVDWSDCHHADVAHDCFLPIDNSDSRSLLKGDSLA